MSKEGKGPRSEESQVRPTAAALAHRVGPDADAAQIADAIVTLWEEIDAILTPIIGQRGTAGLCRRSLYLTSATYSWLAATHEGVAVIDPTTLRSVLSGQSAAAAAAAGSALLQTFHELLTSLIGSLLTEKLLHCVWTNSSSDRPAQDTLP